MEEGKKQPKLNMAELLKEIPELADLDETGISVLRVLFHYEDVYNINYPPMSEEKYEEKYNNLMQRGGDPKVLSEVSPTKKHTDIHWSKRLLLQMAHARHAKHMSKEQKKNFKKETNTHPSFKYKFFVNSELISNLFYGTIPIFLLFDMLFDNTKILGTITKAWEALGFVSIPLNLFSDRVYPESNNQSTKIYSDPLMRKSDKIFYELLLTPKISREKEGKEVSYFEIFREQRELYRDEKGKFFDLAEELDNEINKVQLGTIKGLVNVILEHSKAKKEIDDTLFDSLEELEKDYTNGIGEAGKTREELEKFNKEYNDKIDGIESNSLTRTEDIEARRDHDFKKIMRRRAKMDLYKSAIREIDGLFSYENTWAGKIKKAKEEKSFRAKFEQLMPFDMSKSPILSKAINKANLELSEDDYKNLLKVFNIDEKKTKKRWTLADTLMSTAYYIVAWTPLVEQMPHYLQLPMKLVGYGSFLTTWIVNTYAWYNTRKQRNYFDIPHPRKTVRVPEKSIERDNPVKNSVLDVMDARMSRKRALEIARGLVKEHNEQVGQSFVRERTN